MASCGSSTKTLLSRSFNSRSCSPRSRLLFLVRFVSCVCVARVIVTDHQAMRRCCRSGTSEQVSQIPAPRPVGHCRSCAVRIGSPDDLPITSSHRGVHDHQCWRGPVFIVLPSWERPELHHPLGAYRDSNGVACCGCRVVICEELGVELGERGPAIDRPGKRLRSEWGS